MPLLKLKHKQKPMPNIEFIVDMKKYDPKTKPKTYTTGQFNYLNNESEVFLPHVKNIVTYELKNNKNNGKVTKNMVTEAIIDKVTNNIEHESLHKCVRDFTSNKQLISMELPITSQEYIVRTMLNENRYVELISYIVKDVVSVSGISLASSKFLMNENGKLYYVLFLYNLALTFMVVFTRDSILKFVFFGVHLGLLMFMLYQIRIKNRWGGLSGIRKNPNAKRKSA